MPDEPKLRSDLGYLAVHAAATRGLEKLRAEALDPLALAYGRVVMADAEAELAQAHYRQCLIEREALLREIEDLISNKPRGDTP